MIRRAIGLLLLLLIAAAAAWALWPRPVEVETAVIDRRTIEITVEEEGKTRIREVFTVSSPLAGRMERLDLHPGDTVLANQSVVARIRPTAPTLIDTRTRRIAEAAIDAAIAAVDLASAQLSQAEAQGEFLRGELSRAERLAKLGTVPERNLEKARLDLATGEAAIQSARASLVVRQRELERARAALIEPELEDSTENCCVEVKSPVSGRVLRVIAESEQVVQAGAALAELGNPQDLEIVVDLLSRDAVRVSPGASATIGGWGGSVLHARVYRIDPAAFTKVSALGIEEQRVSVILKPEGDEAEWAKLGHEFRIVARITISSRENVIAVPIGALFRSEGKWAAFVIRDGRAELAMLELGERNASFAEVKTGLSEGETVILHPSDQIEAGTRVTPAEAPEM
jgi:HlyD family secretion protein